MTLGGKAANAERSAPPGALWRGARGVAGLDSRQHVGGSGRVRRSRWRTVGILLLFALVASPVHAEEQYDEFLEKLREKGYHDMALEYLQQMRGSPLARADIKPTIPYEEGITLIAAAAAEHDVELKTRHLDQAREKLREFVKSSPEHPLVAGAESQLANVLVERAKTLLQKIARPAFAAQKDELTKQSRGLFAESQKAFVSAEGRYEELLKKYPKSIDPKDAKQIEARDRARNDLLQARLYAGRALYETSKSYPPGSPDAKKLLESAAAKFGELHEKYRSRLVGLLARVYQGQCYQDLGDTAKALSYYGEVLTQPDEPDQLRKLKANALHLAMQCWTSEKSKKYDEAIRQGQQWLAKARGVEGRTSDWLAVRYYVALALKKQADAQKQEVAKKRQLLSEARRNAKEVAGIAGEYQQQAKQLYQELVGVDDGDEKPVSTFAEALERGKEALDIMQARDAQIKVAPSMKDEANVPKYEQEGREARDRAKDLFHRALELKAADTPLDDVNTARYYLCYLNYQLGEYYDAAVLGEFLARKHPTAAGARPSAKIAMAAYLQAYNAAAKEDRQFERDRMLALADYVTRRFAGEADADDAWIVLIVLAANEQQLDKAFEYLEKVPAESPRRGEAELKAGQAMWSAYLAAAGKEAAHRPPQVELERMLKQAQETLARGLDRMRKQLQSGAVVDYSLVAAALSLAQIYVGADEAAKAVALLEDPAIGPVAIVAANNRLAEQGNFAIETYKIALRAYVATQALDKAEKMMNDLEALIAKSGDAQGIEMLTRIYITLGRELEEQVAILRKENKAAQLDRVTAGFKLFLDRISAREKGNTFNSLNWVAETFYRLASGYEVAGKETPAQAREYYRKAAAVDEKIMATAQADPNFVRPEAMFGVKLRMARCQRSAGDYKQAVDSLVEILSERPMLLDVQKEAAYTYQEWGKKKQEYYTLAIAGAHKAKDERGQEGNVIWGWSRLADITRRNAKFQDVFHEARYNLATCYLLQARQQSEADKQILLDRAEGSIKIVARLRPDMGGSEWSRKYDLLLRTIQVEAGRPATGLGPLKPPSDVGKAKTAAAMK